MKLTLPLLLILGLLVSSCSGSSEMQSVELPTLPPDTEIFSAVDQMPEMQPDQFGVYQYLRYPDDARRAKREGRTVVAFVVDTEGAVKNVEVASSSGYDDLDRAAMRAVAQVIFTPGMMDGGPVNVSMMQPVQFRLGETIRL